MTNLKRLVKWAAIPALAGLAAASVIAVTTSSGPGAGEASSHREAPLISNDPQADTTDLYAFVSPDAPDRVTLIANWIPLEEPAGGPNFYSFGDDVYYEFAIDNNGDAHADVTYSFKFHTERKNPNTFLYATGPIGSLSDGNWNIRQTFDMYRKMGNGPYELVASNLATPPNNIGPVSTPDYDSLAAAAVNNLGDGVRVFAGQRDDPFFVDLGSIFDLATIRKAPGNAGGGIDNVAGFNTHAIILQLPISQLTACHCDPAPGDASAVLGVWSDTYRDQFKIFGQKGGQLNGGQRVKVSRLGNPLVNEVVIPVGMKDTFNGSDPKDDGQFLPFVVDSGLAAGLNAVYKGVIKPIPTTPRLDLAQVFLFGVPGLNQPPNVVPAEELRLNVGIKPGTCGTPKRLGVLAGDNCGFPNGRRLADDVTDIELRAVACGYGFNLGPCVDAAPNNLVGDGVDGNDKPFATSFPYVASPHSGFASPHNASPLAPLGAGLGVGALVAGLLIVGSQALSRIRTRRQAPA